MNVLQIGYFKSGNYWLYQILEAALARSGHRSRRFITQQEIHPLAQGWPLNWKDQSEIDMFDITDDGVFYRIGAIFRWPIDGAVYARSCSHAWTHSAWCHHSEDVFSNFSHVFYIIRDPRDIAISWSRFLFTDYMRRFYPAWRRSCQCPDEFLAHHLLDVIRDWRDHVTGYFDEKHRFRMQILFYERMHADIANELQRILAFMGIVLDEDERAMIASLVNFATMREDHPHHLRRGLVAEWREALSIAQNESVLNEVAELLTKLGYELT